ncbi:helix-turn-helix domain-containing protein [Paraburkholderia sp. BR10936]|uniref:helix-turn-helix domain-containing protein n=1 Tax=Paraburkholderia sp. BR10936 TaxID=3236993 RepID=UPI0034D33549
MTVQIDSTASILRKRFGAILQARREDIGMTQLDMCVELDYSAPTMVSQVERGTSALPEVDLMLWADLLRINRAEFAHRYTRYCRPFVHEAMTGEDVFKAEGLARPAKTIKPRPKKRGADAKLDSRQVIDRI